MSKFEFEGETDSLNTMQQDYIIEVLEKKGYRDCKIRIEAVGKAGDNFVANVKRIIIKKKDKNIFKMIAKIAPSNEFVRASGAAMWFKNENVKYGEVFPKLLELQNVKDISEDFYKFRVPECYGILTEEPNELILMEDLEGYAIQDKVKPLSNESVKTILKTFATFHSLSFIWRSRNSASFEATTNKLFDVLGTMNKMPGFDQHLTGLVNNAKVIINDKEYEKVFEVISNEWLETVENLTKNEDTSKYSVVIHGDAWINNMLFKEKDGQLDCIAIDYQQSKLSSPACDILHLIFTSTDHETRHRHFHEWLDYYHTQLDKCLVNFGLKVDVIYPKDQFNADIKKYSKVYFGVGFLMFALMFIKPEDAAILRELQEKSSGGDMSEMFGNAAELLAKIDCLTMRSRLVGLVDSFREFGFIDM